MKTAAILTTLLVAVSMGSMSLGVVSANAVSTEQTTVATLVGAGESCTCQGAGRVASCPPPCTCDYDWQGYPRCSSTSGGGGL